MHYCQWEYNTIQKRQKMFYTLWYQAGQLRIEKKQAAHTFNAAHLSPLESAFLQFSISSVLCQKLQKLKNGHTITYLSQTDYHVLPP